MEHIASSATPIKLSLTFMKKILMPFVVSFNDMVWDGNISERLRSFYHTHNPETGVGCSQAIAIKCSTNPAITSIIGTS